MGDQNVSLPDQITTPYIKKGGKDYNIEEIIVALGKALVKKGVLTKAEILAEL